MNFTRGLDPKRAMNIGMKRCSMCNKIIIHEEFGDKCDDCLEELYGIGERSLFETKLKLTPLGKITLFIIIVSLLITILL